MAALGFVNRCSEIEALATQRITAELACYRVTCDAVYGGNIHLDASAAGQQKLSDQQRQAEASRAQFVQARRIISRYSAGILSR